MLSARRTVQLPTVGAWAASGTATATHRKTQSSQSSDTLHRSEYVEHLLRDQVAVSAGSSLTPAQRATGWLESVKGLPHTPPLSDEAISRENLDGDRE